MAQYNMDKLYEAVEEKGHVCVGLDTAPTYIPPAERRRAASDSEAVFAFNKAIMDAAWDAAACFKVQIACYEELGLAGLKAYAETLRYIRGRGGLVIADIKRGDIADTASRYAAAHFSGDFEADFVTLSPYMGMDSIEPWFSWAGSAGKGAFVLMRTSNRGMKDFEYLELKYGEDADAKDAAAKTGRRGRRLYEAVGEKLSALAAAKKGKYGYGAFGAVAGCTERDEAALIRETYDSLFFLIPGYGAQGGAADDAALLLRNGNGGVVNASRSVLRAWMETCEDPEKAGNASAGEAARNAALDMRDAIRAAASA
jgi:orotidine-5'-phosphate decarboxylase